MENNIKEDINTTMNSQTFEEENNINNDTITQAAVDTKKKSLPKSTIVLIFGIISIASITHFFSIAGIILSIIAICYTIKSKKIYKKNPSIYYSASYNNLRIGNILAYIGLILNILYACYFFYTTINSIQNINFSNLIDSTWSQIGY